MSVPNNPTSSEAITAAPAGKRRFGIGMLAVGIAAGAMFAPAGFAGAQDGTDADDTTADDTSTDAPRTGHRGHRGAVLESLGIDAESIRSGIEADQSLVQIAEANGVSEADLTAAIQADIETHLADAVESGRLTQDEADEKLVDITANIAERINTVPSERPERGNRGRFGGGEVLDELGLTVEDIRTGRQAGQTLAETAAANGVSETELVDALVAQATERAEAALDAGRIDADRAAELIDGLDERITERVNAEPGERGERGLRGRGGNSKPADTAETSASF